MKSSATHVRISEPGSGAGPVCGPGREYLPGRASVRAYGCSPGYASALYWLNRWSGKQPERYGCYQAAFFAHTSTSVANASRVTHRL